jgi:GNAT superfamily N-acetyltransferase
MSTVVGVRLARAGDLAAVIGLLSMLHDPGDAEAIPREARTMFERILRQYGRRLLVAEVDGRIVGTTDVLVVENLSRGLRPWAAVENVVVDPQSRRQGVGRALVQAAVDYATECGCYKIQLLSNRKRRDAHAFYRSLGFDAEVEGFRRYLGR